MSVFEEINKIFEEANIDYEIVEHEPVFTSEEAARIRDSDISRGAKALVLMADKRPILAVVPGDKRADFRKLKKLLGIKDLRMATPEEVKNVTGLEIGAIPPVGKAMGLDSYYAEEFLDKDRVAFNAGSHTISIFVKASDLIKTERPAIHDIT